MKEAIFYSLTVVLIIVFALWHVGVIKAPKSAAKTLLINERESVKLDEGTLTRLIKKKTSKTSEVLQSVVNVLASCQKLEKNPLTKEILVNVVQAAFPSETVVTELVDFEEAVKVASSFPL